MKVIFFPPEKGELQHVIYDFIMLVLYHFEQYNILWKRTDLNNDETRASSPHTFSVKWNLDPFSHEKRKRKAVSHKERLHTRKTYGNCHQHYQARLCRVDLPWVASVTKCQSEGLSLHLRSPASMVFTSVFWGEMNKEYNSFIQVSSLSVSYFRVFYNCTNWLSKDFCKDYLGSQYQTIKIIPLDNTHFDYLFPLCKINKHQYVSLYKISNRRSFC